MGRDHPEEGGNPPPPQAAYEQFEPLLGEALRRLAAEPGLRSPAIALALAKAAGLPALRSALAGRAAAGGVAARIGLAAGAAVAATALGAVPALPLAVAGAAIGAGWLATARRVTPLRRRFESVIGEARRTWQETRAAWLGGTLSRAERDRATEQLLQRLIDELRRAAIS